MWATLFDPQGLSSLKENQLLIWDGINSAQLNAQVNGRTQMAGPGHLDLSKQVKQGSQEHS